MWMPKTRNAEASAARFGGANALGEVVTQKTRDDEAIEFGFVRTAECGRPNLSIGDGCGYWRFTEPHAEIVGGQSFNERSSFWSGHTDFVEDGFHVVGERFFLAKNERDGIGRTDGMRNCGAESRKLSTSCIDEAQGQGGFARQSST